MKKKKKTYEDLNLSKVAKDVIKKLIRSCRDFDFVYSIDLTDEERRWIKKFAEEEKLDYLQLSQEKKRINLEEKCKEFDIAYMMNEDDWGVINFSCPMRFSYGGKVWEVNNMEDFLDIDIENIGRNQLIKRIKEFGKIIS
jgi:hypothetical protein